MQTSSTYKPATGLFRHGLILLVATQVGNVATMLFQIVMMRRLSTVEYGILASMLSLVLIIGTPLEALRTAVAHQSALYMRLGQGGAIKSFIWQWTRFLLLLAIVLVLVTLALQGVVARTLQLPATYLVFVTGCIIAATLFMPLLQGGLQGVQAFFWMAIHGQVWGVVRLVMALLLFAWVTEPSAAVGLYAQAIAVAASIFVGGWALARVLRSYPLPDPQPFAGWNYFLLSLGVLGGYAVLMNADVALVKALFDPDSAGQFAQAATIGRSIVFLPLPITAVMFPKVVSAGFSSIEDRAVLKKAVLFTAALIIAAGTFCSVAVNPIWQVFTGRAIDATAAGWVRGVIWALAPLGLTFLLMNFEMAQRRFRAPALLLMLAPVYAGAVYFFSAGSIPRVIAIMAMVNLSSLIIIGLDIFRTQK